MVRIWWLVLVLTVSAVVALLLAPPTTDQGYECLDSAASILVTPGYTEFEGVYVDAGSGPSPCAQAARDQFGFAMGVGLLGGAMTWLSRRIGIRRRTRAGGARPIEAGVPTGS